MPTVSRLLRTPGRFVARTATLATLLALAACGGGGNWSNQKAFVTVGGNVTGLAGTVVLRNNGNDTVTVSTSGAFKFGLSIANGSAYAVTVGTQPAGQFCTVTSGSGNASADITNVAVNCVSDATIGGTVSGLTGTLVLQNNGTNSLATATNGTFQFTQRVGAGRPYNVTVLTHPDGQTCTIANASGTVSANVTNVAVTCNTFVARALPAIYNTGKAIAYGAFRAGGPGVGEVPTDAQVLEDLTLMNSAGFNLIRLFGSDAVSDKVLRLAAANFPAMQFQLGIYLQGASAPACTDAVNTAQMTKGIELARAYTNVATVSVGNETSFANNLPVSCLVSYVRNVRSQVLQPVTADDDQSFFAGRAGNGSKPDTVVQILDFVAIHTYPMSYPAGWDWQQTAVAAGPARAQAMMLASRDFAALSYDNVANYSYRTADGTFATIGATRPIVIGETGWKARQTNGASSIEGYAARAVNAKWYMDLMRAWERSTATAPKAIFYFDAFDEGWKGNDDGWGLWDSARAARYGLCGTAAGTACNADLYAGAGYFGAVAPATGSYAVLDFNTAGLTYTVTPFGDESAVITAAGVPAGGPTGQVLKITRPVGAQCWAGTTASVGDKLSIGTVPFASNATTMTVRIHAPAAGLNVKLKLEDANNAGVTVETDVLTTAAGWQTLTFDFANQAPGTAALNTAATYNKLSIFPNFSCGSGAPADADFYVGPITFIGANAPSAPPLVAPPPATGAVAYTIIDFDNAAVTSASFGAEGGGIAAAGSYPAGGPTGNVFQLGRGGSPDRSFCWSGTTFGLAADFSIPAVPFSATATRISLQIYSPSASPIVRMKLENAGNAGISVETDQPLVVGWQTVTFDFASAATGTSALNAANVYNKLSIFPGFSCAGPWGTPNELGVDTVFFIGPIRFLGG